jgi:hypothetical protein
VTAIWLLPFYPSPLRDDGYDIADYRSINPGLRHDARLQAPSWPRRTAAGCGSSPSSSSTTPPTSTPGSSAPAHAPSPARRARLLRLVRHRREVPETRIIFLDTEKSNWTWDPVAGAFFWHRFYSHQPDLNFDNPRVLEEVLKVMRFWLDMGVDGLRLDAIPYLVERDGTNNENLPGDPRRPEEDPRRARPALSRPHAARRGEPVAGGHPPLFRRRRRVPHGLPLPADAAHVHGARPGGPAPDHRHHPPDAGDPRRLPVGDLPAQPRRADARDGDRRRARLPLETYAEDSRRGSTSASAAASRR